VKCPRTSKPIDPKQCRKCKYLGELHFKKDKLTGVICFPDVPANRREVHAEDGRLIGWKNKAVFMGDANASKGIS